MKNNRSTEGGRLTQGGAAARRATNLRARSRGNREVMAADAERRWGG